MALKLMTKCPNFLLRLCYSGEIITPIEWWKNIRSYDYIIHSSFSTFMCKISRNNNSIAPMGRHHKSPLP